MINAGLTVYSYTQADFDKLTSENVPGQILSGMPTFAKDGRVYVRHNGHVAGLFRQRFCVEGAIEIMPPLEMITGKTA